MNTSISLEEETAVSFGRSVYKILSNSQRFKDFDGDFGEHEVIVKSTENYGGNPTVRSYMKFMCSDTSNKGTVDVGSFDQAGLAFGTKYEFIINSEDIE